MTFWPSQRSEALSLPEVRLPAIGVPTEVVLSGIGRVEDNSSQVGEVFPTIRVTTVMRTRQLTTDHRQRAERRYALYRGPGVWELTFEGRPTIFKHEQGALYVACLLLEPPDEPIHAVALELKARKMAGEAAGAEDVIQQRNLGLDDAEAVRNLRRQQRELEAALEDDLESEPAKSVARREIEKISEFLRKNSWRSQDSAQKCVRAVAMALRRLHTHLGRAVDVQGKPHPVLGGFAQHLRKHMLNPSGRGGGHGGARIALPRRAAALPTSRRRGWFGAGRRTGYSSNRFCAPIQGEIKRLESKVQRPRGGRAGPKSIGLSRRLIGRELGATGFRACWKGQGGQPVAEVSLVETGLVKHGKEFAVDANGGGVGPCHGFHVVDLVDAAEIVHSPQATAATAAAPSDPAS